MDSETDLEYLYPIAHTVPIALTWMNIGYVEVYSRSQIYYNCFADSSETNKETWGSTIEPEWTTKKPIPGVMKREKLIGEFLHHVYDKVDVMKYSNLN